MQHMVLLKKGITLSDFFYTPWTKHLRILLCMVFSIALGAETPLINTQSIRFTIEPLPLHSNLSIDKDWTSWEIHDRLGNGFVFRLRLPAKEKLDSAALMLFLDGSGSNGHDNSAQMHYPNFLKMFEGDRALNAVVIVPQCAVGDSWDSLQWTGPAPPQTNHAAAPLLDLLVDLVTEIKNQFAISSSHCLIWGFSQGAFGTLDTLVHYPDSFGAYISLGGGNDPIAVADALGHQSLWLFHGGKDSNVNPEHSQRIARAVAAAGKSCHLIIFPDAPHQIMDSVLLNPEFVAFLRQF